MTQVAGDSDTQRNINQSNIQPSPEGGNAGVNMTQQSPMNGNLRQGMPNISFELSPLNAEKFKAEDLKPLDEKTEWNLLNGPK